MGRQALLPASSPVTHVEMTADFNNVTQPASNLALTSSAVTPGPTSVNIGIGTEFAM
jgi:hypothetical protein